MRRLLVSGVLAAGALISAPAAVAATAPTVVTGPVTAIGPTTATVSGSVNPNGSATTYHFEYGTSTTYGSGTTPASAGSGTTAVAVSGSFTGLKPGTTYHYRLDATNGVATTHGADGILTTSSAPVAVTGSATGVTATTATLNGTVNPGGRDTTWYFDYGTSTSYGKQTPVKDAGAGTDAVGVSAAVTGLTTGKLYHFRLVAKSDAGTSRGADATFLPTSAPAAVTKAASSVTDTGAKLNGTVNPSGQATTAYFEYGTSTSYGTKTTAKSVGSGSSTTGVSISVTGLKPGTVYHFRLVATSAAGTGTGADMTFTTSGPPVVATGPANGIGATGATLNGSVDPNGHSTNWYFEYGPTTGYGTKTASRSAGSARGAKAVATAVSGLAPGTTYHYRLVATSSAGTALGADAMFTTTGPAVTIAAAARAVVFGHGVLLSGTIASKQSNRQVAVFAQRFGATSFSSVATVLTGANGVWTIVVRPAIRTTYKATWNGTASSTVTIGVRPAISLSVLTGGRFATRVAPAAHFHGRVAQLQRRRANGTWVTISRKRLSGSSTAVFHPALPRGRSSLRIAVSAGGGYLAGYSRTVTYRRR
jgi:hypothetical protein